MPSSNVPKCSEQGECPSGTFNADKSSTFKEISQGTFNVSYGDGTGATGDYFTDVVHVDGAEIKAGIMAIGLATDLIDGQIPNDGTGLVGVGYNTLQAADQAFVQDGLYPQTLIEALVNGSSIDRPAFSLYLNDNNAPSGAIVFGGVDTAKYTGDLTALIVQPYPNGITDYTYYNVAWTGVSIKDGNGERTLTDSSFAYSTLLDSGTTLAEIPPELYNTLASGLGVDAQGFLPCGYGATTAVLTFYFGGQGGPSIDVPISSLILPYDGQTTFSDGTSACMFGLQSGDPSNVILGDAFMRSGYFVYDLANNVIAMAQAKLNATDESITAISSGTAIPGCTSTNTLLLSQQTGAETAPIAQPTATGTSLVQSSPTFALGSAAASAGSSGSGSSGNKNAAVHVRTEVVGGLITAAAVVFGLAMAL